LHIGLNNSLPHINKLGYRLKAKLWFRIPVSYEAIGRVLFNFLPQPSNINPQVFGLTAIFCPPVNSYRTYVQFLQVLDRENIQIEIWERGAGYYLASGSSSCAAAAVMHRLGLFSAKVTVNMPGGQLQVNNQEEFTVSLAGPVRKVFEGEFLAGLAPVDTGLPQNLDRCKDRTLDRSRYTRDPPL
jgi:hypothetical protein